MARRLQAVRVVVAAALAVLVVAATARQALQREGAPRFDTPIVISEFLADNRGGLRDEDGDSPGWIELHNESDAPVNLRGWSLTDDRSQPNKWTFPERPIDPDEYLIVFASGKNRGLPDQPLHTNFRLNGAGEYLALHDSAGHADGKNIFFPRFPRQSANVAFGRSGGRLGYLETPSPGAPPGESITLEGVVAPVEFSVTQAFHRRGFELRLRTDTRGAEIHYTLDGSSPGPDTGIRYRRPIWIEDTAVVRASAARPGWIASGERMHTYIFPSRVGAQNRPPGYPDHWAEGLPAHYEMNVSAADADELAEALRAIPTLSLSTHPDHLFNPATGIYMNPENDGVEWERPVSVEWTGPDGAQGFHVNAGLRIQGRSSRKPATSPKHSFRLLFKTDYGTGTLRFPLFNEEGPREFETLVLRASSNNSWTFPLAEQRERAQYIRDAWAKDTQRAMGHPAPRSRYVHLYLNGLYWGLYCISERPDAAFAAQRFGGPRAGYDVCKGAEWIEGDDRAWRTMFAIARAGLHDDASYAAIQDYLDIDNFIDYMMLNHYGGNENWDYGNWYAARRRQDDETFRFYAWDMESILGRTGENKVFVRNRDRPTELFHRLRENADFRSRFAQRATMHLSDGGALTAAAATDRFIARAKEIELAILAESARWGGYRMKKHPYRTGPFKHYTRQDWYAEQKRLATEYFPQRAEMLLDQYRKAGLL